MLENSAAVVPTTLPRSAQKDAQKDALKWRQGRSAATNDPRFLPKRPLSRRALDRRRKDLVSSFLAALGPDAPNGLTAVMVRRAAELTTAAEMARANALNGVPTDMLALVRLEGVASRAVRALGLKTEPPPAKALGLALARRRWAEEAERAKKAAPTTHTTEPPE
jgi:hypothetical protein